MGGFNWDKVRRNRNLERYGGLPLNSEESCTATKDRLNKGEEASFLAVKRYLEPDEKQAGSLRHSSSSASTGKSSSGNGNGCSRQKVDKGPKAPAKRRNVVCPQGMVVCPYCRNFISEKRLDRHIRKVHGAALKEKERTTHVRVALPQPQPLSSVAASTRQSVLALAGQIRRLRLEQIKHLVRLKSLDAQLYEATLNELREADRKILMQANDDQREPE